MYIAAGGSGLMQPGLAKLVRQHLGPVVVGVIWFGMAWVESWFGGTLVRHWLSGLWSGDGGEGIWFGVGWFGVGSDR